MPGLNISGYNLSPPSSPPLTSPRLQGFFRRFSSGFSAKLPSSRNRQAAAKRKETQRSKTIPKISDADTGDDTDSFKYPSDFDAPIPKIAIPKLSKPDRSDQNDTTSYHSFPSIERSRCHVCGLSSPLPRTSDFPNANRLCQECRSRSPLSCISFGRKQAHVEDQQERLVKSNLSHHMRHTPSPIQGPRPVSEASAAKKFGNPPRRTPVSSSSSPTWSENRSASSSPKIHHIHVLPNAKAYPYVHRNEALQSRSVSPKGKLSIVEPSKDGRNAAAVPRRRADYSETVFYGCPITSVVHNAPNGPLFVWNSAMDSHDTLQDSYHYSERNERNDLWQNSRRQTPSRNTTLSSPDTRITPLVGERRLELKGGASHHNEVPRLRGGCGKRETSGESFWFKVKRWLLTGSRRDHQENVESDADEPLARIPTTSSVSRRSNRTVGLPENVSRHSSETSRSSISNRGTTSGTVVS